MRRTFLDIPVRRAMTRRPASVGPEDALGYAAGAMVHGGFRHLPVIDADARLVGMLSERDLRTRLGTELERFPEAARALLAESVEETMRPDPIRVGPSTSLRQVLEILSDEKIGAVPVVDRRERLVGIVSYLDLLGFAHAWQAAAILPLGREVARPPPRAAPARARRRKGATARARTGRATRKRSR
jgi:CBS domain-containing protein